LPLVGCVPVTCGSFVGSYRLPAFYVTLPFTRFGSSSSRLPHAAFGYVHTVAVCMVWFWVRSIALVPVRGCAVAFWLDTFYVLFGLRRLVRGFVLLVWVVA